MIRISSIAFLTALLLISCKKDPDPVDLPDIPEGSEPYTEANIQFVPYSGGSRIYELMPELLENFTLTFKERKRTEAYWAWDQTWLTFSTDPTLEVELRLRYLESDASVKTLAIYMPYYDNSSVLRTSVFEIPIESPEEIESGFFAPLIDYHDTLVLNSTEWYEVYEVSPLVSTSADKDSPTNFSKLYYNTTYGIIQIRQKNGDEWAVVQ